MFANGLQPWHIIVLVIVLIALFGAKRLPAAARGIGQSMRIFKSEAKSLREDHDHADSGESPEPGPSPAESKQIATPNGTPTRDAGTTPTAQAPTGTSSTQS